jgi:hypothetical protein
LSVELGRGGYRDPGNEGNDMDDNLITIKMTRRELEDLVRILDSAQDEGPSGEGWASKELSSLRGFFESELDALKKAER